MAVAVAVVVAVVVVALVCVRLFSLLCIPLGGGAFLVHVQVFRERRKGRCCLPLLLSLVFL